MKAEWESSKLAHEATRAEFESYKVRLRLSIYIFISWLKVCNCFLSEIWKMAKDLGVSHFRFLCFTQQIKKKERKKGNKEIKKNTMNTLLQNKCGAFFFRPASTVFSNNKNPNLLPSHLRWRTLKGLCASSFSTFMCK